MPQESAARGGQVMAPAAVRAARIGSVTCLVSTKVLVSLSVTPWSARWPSSWRGLGLWSNLGEVLPDELRLLGAEREVAGPGP